jgi:hypothetical protein
MPAFNRGVERRRGRRFRSARAAARLAGFGDDDIAMRALSGASLLATDEFRLAVFEGLLWCSGCIDAHPIDCSDIVAFLQLRSLGRGVGRIALALANPSYSGSKIRLEEEADERDIPRPCDVADGGSFGFTRKYGVHDHGMAL